jgi:hypothetical protein
MLVDGRRIAAMGSASSSSTTTGIPPAGAEAPGVR